MASDSLLNVIQGLVKREDRIAKEEDKKAKEKLKLEKEKEEGEDDEDEDPVGDPAANQPPADEPPPEAEPAPGEPEAEPEAHLKIRHLNPKQSRNLKMMEQEILNQLVPIQF